MQRWTPFFFLITSLSSLAIGAAVEARPFRVDDIPNGSKFSCLNCHGDTKASYNTDFGSDARNYLIPVGVISGQHVDWTPLCPLDSDRDGWTNGQELGDPDCLWKKGDANPKGVLTNPGVYESAPPPVCGSGKLEAAEACDGDLLSVMNCMLVGAGEGSLTCTADCKFDYSGCSEPPGTTPIPDPPVGTEGESEDVECSIKGVGQGKSDNRSVLGFLGLVLLAKLLRSRGV